jgi:hypothetical protein
MTGKEAERQQVPRSIPVIKGRIMPRAVKILELDYGYSFKGLPEAEIFRFR